MISGENNDTRTYPDVLLITVKRISNALRNLSHHYCNKDIVKKNSLQYYVDFILYYYKILYYNLPTK